MATFTLTKETVIEFDVPEELALAITKQFYFYRFLTLADVLDAFPQLAEEMCKKESITEGITEITSIYDDEGQTIFER